VVVLDAEARLFPAVPPLGDMVWDSRCDDPRDARQEGSLGLSGRQINSYVWCPRNLCRTVGMSAFV
jgi:hypothetical protein